MNEQRNALTVQRRALMTERVRRRERAGAVVVVVLGSPHGDGATVLASPQDGPMLAHAFRLLARDVEAGLSLSNGVVDLPVKTKH